MSVTLLGAPKPSWPHRPRLRGAEFWAWVLGALALPHSLCDLGQVPGTLQTSVYPTWSMVF